MSNLNKALSNLGQQFAIASNKKNVAKVFPTGFRKFDDEVLGTGGFVGGRIYELYAKASAGKTTLMLKFIANMQKQDSNFLAMYLDAEEALYLGSDRDSGSLGWVESLGVDLDRLIIPDFQTGEDAFKVIKTAIASGVNFIVLDTVASLMPSALIHRDNETAKMNEKLALANLLSIQINELGSGFKAHRVTKTGREQLIEIDDKTYSELVNKKNFSIPDRTVHKLKYYNCVFVAINHAKDMVGVMYGDPTYTPGGSALNFFSSVRIGMSEPIKSKEKVKDAKSGVEVPLFRKTRVTAAKNKLSPPFNEVTFKIYRDGRVEEDIVFWQEAVKLDLVETTVQSVIIKETGEKMRKKEFEIWASSHPEFFKGKLEKDKFEDLENDFEDDFVPRVPDNREGSVTSLSSFLKKKRK